MHVNDPEFMDQLFGGAGKRRDKSKVAINGIGTPGSVLGTMNHDLHRVRRATLNPYFSKQSIRRLEPILQGVLEKVLSRLKRNAKSGEPMKMNILFTATTTDIIWDYCFGENPNTLDLGDLNEPFVKAFADAAQGYHASTFMPWLQVGMKALPFSLVVLLMPVARAFLEIIQV